MQRRVRFLGHWLAAARNCLSESVDRRLRARIEVALESRARTDVVVSVPNTMVTCVILSLAHDVSV